MYILLLSIVAILLLLIATGTIYQRIGSRLDRDRYTEGGRWVNIEPNSGLYIVEKGFGGPTMVFEAGISASHLNWRHIQDQVAEFAHTVSYDRLGLGWSSPARTPRTPGNIAMELRQLLETAGLKPPFILVAHSFGGLVARRYALLYPEQVAGVVLVDPMRCEEWPPLDAGKQSQVDRGKRLIRYASPIAHCGLARLAVTSAFRRSGKLSNQLAGAAGSGAQHVLGRIKSEVGKMPREVWPIVAAHWSRPGFYSGMRMYLDSIPDTVTEMDAAEPIRDIPVTLLTPGESTPLTDTGIERIGNRVQQIIDPESAHWIHLDEPDLVIESIRSMIANTVAAEAASVQ